MAKAPPSLMEHALAASENIQALAVGLAHAGASPDAIKQLGECNGLMHQIIKALGAGPSLDGASGGQAGPGAEPQSAPQPGGAPSGPPQASEPESAPSGPPQAALQPGGGTSMGDAAVALMAAHAAANAKK